VKQLQKLVKVRYVEDITDAERVGKSAIFLVLLEACMGLPACFDTLP